MYTPRLLSACSLRRDSWWQNRKSMGGITCGLHTVRQGPPSYIAVPNPYPTDESVHWIISEWILGGGGGRGLPPRIKRSERQLVPSYWPQSKCIWFRLTGFHDVTIYVSRNSIVDCLLPFLSPGNAGIKHWNTLWPFPLQSLVHSTQLHFHLAERHVWAVTLLYYIL
jgi:hypothetical protein